MNALPHEHRFCPSCGFDFSHDVPIILDQWSMYGLGYPLCYQGKPLSLTVSESQVCWTLMKAYPRSVTSDAILNRIGSDGSVNTLAVLICRIRKRLDEVEIPCPIRTVRGQGYVWLAGRDR